MLAFGYAASHGGKTLLWAFANTFLLFLLIERFGLRPSDAAFVILALGVADALTHPLAAAVIHHAQHRGGGMRNSLLVALPVCCAAFALLFAIQKLGQVEAIAFAFGAGVAFRVAFVFVDIPLNVSLGRFNHDSRARTRIAAGRTVAGALAQLGLAVATVAFVERNGLIDQQRLSEAAVVVAVVSGALIILGFPPVDAAATRLERRVQANAAGPVRWFHLLTHKDLLALTVANVAFLFAGSQVFGALIFVTQYSPQPATSFGWAWTLQVVGSALLIAPWAYAASRFEKSQVCIVSLLGLGLVSALTIPLLAAPLGLALVVGALCVVSQTNTLIWTMLPDALDQASFTAGKSVHAVVGGAFTLVGKLAMAAGTVLSGVMLEISGAPDQFDIPRYWASTVVISIVGALGAALALSAYRLTHAKVAAIYPLDRPQTLGSIKRLRD